MTKYQCDFCTQWQNRWVKEFGLQDGFDKTSVHNNALDIIFNLSKKIER